MIRKFKVQSKGSQMAGKGYFDIGFCKYSKFFLKIYVPATVVKALCCLKRLLDFEVTITHFTLNFLKFRKLAGCYTRTLPGCYVPA